MDEGLRGFVLSGLCDGAAEAIKLSALQNLQSGIFNIMFNSAPFYLDVFRAKNRCYQTA